MPAMNSSTSTPSGYCSSILVTTVRRLFQSRVTDSSLIPLDEPSKFGFTIAGIGTPSDPPKNPSSLFASARSRWVNSRPRGVSMPWDARTRLVSHLSSVTVSVCASDPVYG